MEYLYFLTFCLSQSKNEKVLATENGKKQQRKSGLVDEGEPSQTEENINLTAPQ